MHKSVLIAVVVASLLVAYPLTMLGISAEQSVHQNQNSITQMADSTTQQESKKLPTLTQNQMQQQQLEKLQQSSLGAQQTQNDELQMTEEIESQQEEDKKLSIISQEKMQQAQFEKFKNLLNSVRDKHITVIQE
jgi:hypothetical protein